MPSAFSSIASARLKEPFGLGVLAFLVVQDGQTDEGVGHIGVVFAERLLADRQRALVEYLGVGVLALRPAYNGQVVKNLSHIGVVCAERLLADRQRALQECLGARRTCLAPCTSWPDR